MEKKKEVEEVKEVKKEVVEIVQIATQTEELFQVDGKIMNLNSYLQWIGNTLVEIRKGVAGE